MAEPNKEILNGRLEDYQGNILNFSGSGSGSGGIMIGAEEVDQIDYLTSGNLVADNKSATNLSIFISTSPSQIQNVLNANIEDLKFGTYAIMLRMMVSHNTSEEDIIRIQTFYATETSEILLSTTFLKPSYFKLSNNYETFGFLTDFKGNYASDAKLRIKVQLMRTPVALNITLDYIIINFAYTSIIGRTTQLI